MVSDVDINRDGQIDYEEFLAFMWEKEAPAGVNIKPVPGKANAPDAKTQAKGPPAAIVAVDVKASPTTAAAVRVAATAAAAAAVGVTAAATTAVVATVAVAPPKPHPMNSASRKSTVSAGAASK